MSCQNHGLHDDVDGFHVHLYSESHGHLYHDHADDV